MRLHRFLVVFGVLGLGGCGDTFCDAGGLAVSIWNPPPDVVDYRFTIEFAGEKLEFDCAAEPGVAGWCEHEVAAWRVRAVVYPPNGESDPFNPPIGVGIGRGDDFSSFVPTGEIRIAITSPSAEELHAEHVFVPDIEGTANCQYAYEDWDLAD